MHYCGGDLIHVPLPGGDSVGISLLIILFDSDRDLFYSADKSITFAFVPGYDSGTDVKEGE